MANKKDDSKLKCSFCGKTQNQVRKLIAGPNVYICDQCIELCSEILDEELEMENDEYFDDSDINLLKPKEIKSFLDEYVVGQDMQKKYCPLQCIITTRECFQEKIWMLSCRKVTL